MTALSNGHRQAGLEADSSRGLGLQIPPQTWQHLPGDCRAMLETCGSAGKGMRKGVYLPGDRVVEVSSKGWRWNAGWEGTRPCLP
jgi:hypothetical protein